MLCRAEIALPALGLHCLPLLTPCEPYPGRYAEEIYDIVSLWGLCRDCGVRWWASLPRMVSLPSASLNPKEASEP